MYRIYAELIFLQREQRCRIANISCSRDSAILKNSLPTYLMRWRSSIVFAGGIADSLRTCRFFASVRRGFERRGKLAIVEFERES